MKVSVIDLRTKNIKQLECFNPSNFIYEILIYIKIDSILFTLLYLREEFGLVLMDVSYLYFLLFIRNNEFIDSGKSIKVF